MRNSSLVVQQQTIQPALILVMGVPASGKTTLSKEVLKSFKAVYLDNNFLADPFFPKSRINLFYKFIRRRLYDVLYRITEENLAVGNSVLLDVPHITHMRNVSWRKFISNLAYKNSAHLVIIRCHCSLSSLKARMYKRGEERDKWKLKNWELFLMSEPMDIDIPIPHLDINTDLSIKQQTDYAINYIYQCLS